MQNLGEESGMEGAREIWGRSSGGGERERCGGEVASMRQSEEGGSGQGEVAGAAAARSRGAAAATTIGLLPRSSLSSHLRESSLLSFFK